MKHLFLYAKVILFLYGMNLVVSGIELDILGFEGGETDSLWDYKARAKRFNRTHYGISGTMELLQDLTNEYTLEVKVFHSAMGNNQYTASPLKVNPTPVCDFMQKEYKTYLLNDELKSATNFPKEDSELCPFSKKVYTFNNYVFNQDNLPEFLQSGMYKLHFVYYLTNKPDDVVSVFIVTAKVSNLGN